MNTKTVKVRGLSLSGDKLSRTRTNEARKRGHSVQTPASEPGRHPKHNFSTWQDAARSSLQKLNEVLPGPDQAGFFIDGPPFLSSENQGRTSVQNETDEFHDSDSNVDLYDLYNTTNGIMYHGFPDVRELDKYSADEAKALNVPRLREIWEHTTTGCAQCREIINALDQIRGAVREVADIEDAL
ncbi:MAG TPA: hypothetical protein VN844_15130 [Pyrinomonadaceae bacterium]|nr:hypothetical protein [Pyrinomonadaceae bacterium]